FETRLLYDQLCGRMAQKGYVVHLVHYCNCKPFSKDQAKKVEEALLEHIHSRDGKKPDPTIEDCYPLWMTTSQEGVKFLRQSKDAKGKPLVDGGHVGVVGLSMGGFIATSMVVENPGLKVAVLANIFGGLPEQHHKKVRDANPK